MDGCVREYCFLSIRCTARDNKELLDLGGVFRMRPTANDVPERERQLLCKCPAKVAEEWEAHG